MSTFICIWDLRGRWYKSASVVGQNSGMNLIRGSPNWILPSTAAPTTAAERNVLDTEPMRNFELDQWEPGGQRHRLRRLL
jgi:hypothetical protein